MNKNVLKCCTVENRSEVLEKGNELANAPDTAPKFRVWRLANKLMVYSADFTHLDNFFHYYLDNSPDTKIMQDIELNDMEGNSIFVSDILEDLTGRYYIVFKVKGGFAVNQWQDKDFRFFESTANNQEASYISSSCKIAGNIYEGIGKEN